MKVSFILLLGCVIANLSGCASKNVDPYVLKADKSQAVSDQNFFTFSKIAYPNF